MVIFNVLITRRIFRNRKSKGKDVIENVHITDILLTVVGFLVVYTLNGIKSEIKEVKSAMKELSHELKDIDNRVVILETLNKA